MTAKHIAANGIAKGLKTEFASPLRGAVAWYLRGVERTRPFYCDASRVGAFAIEPDELAAGGDAAVFRLFVTLSMYQAVRDVVIMKQQRSMPRDATRPLIDLGYLKRAIARHDCPVLLSAEAFEQKCDVSKNGEVVDCGIRPGRPCHVKSATVAFHRMGDMGKLPTSAWLRVWKDGEVRKLLAEVQRREASPTRRADLMVERFAQVFRVGRKLATLFVSALSTPALAAGLTPWFPTIDGNELVVVDTNVARAVDALREPGAPKTYDARVKWVRKQAAQLDLRELDCALPRYSPRLVQEALYAFCSKSNRVARGDMCARRATPCSACAPPLCPFTFTVVDEVPPGPPGRCSVP